MKPATYITVPLGRLQPAHVPAAANTRNAKRKQERQARKAGRRNGR